MENTEQFIKDIAWIIKKTLYRSGLIFEELAEYVGVDEELAGVALDNYLATALEANLAQQDQLLGGGND